jgi:hypothetical protein
VPVLDPERDHHGRSIRPATRNDIYQLVDVPGPLLGHAHDGGANQRKGAGMVERLRQPGTLLVVAVVCLASAVGNGL